MILAKVVGTVVSPTEAIDVLAGRKLLVVRPVHPRTGEATAKEPRLAIDSGIGAGVGDLVLVIDEGNSGRQILRAKDAPVKTLVVGFVDSVDLATGTSV